MRRTALINTKVRIAFTERNTSQKLLNRTNYYSRVGTNGSTPTAVGQPGRRGGRIKIELWPDFGRILWLPPQIFVYSTRNVLLKNPYLLHVVIKIAQPFLAKIFCQRLGSPPRDKKITLFGNIVRLFLFVKKACSLFFDHWSSVTEPTSVWSIPMNLRLPQLQRQNMTRQILK